jgi:hypothetical protein
MTLGLCECAAVCSYVLCRPPHFLWPSPLCACGQAKYQLHSFVGFVFAFLGPCHMSLCTVLDYLGSSRGKRRLERVVSQRHVALNCVTACSHAGVVEAALTLTCKACVRLKRHCRCACVCHH